jgi:hypothetical protein
MSVGYLLYREVRDFAPSAWSHTDLVVALMLADDANDDTRKSWIGQSLLCQRANLTERGLRGSLQHLAATGYEFRVIKGYDRNGNPVYAGRAYVSVDYLIPDIMGGTVVPPKPVDNPDIGGTTLPPKPGVRRHESVSKAARDGPLGGTVVPPLSSGLLSISSTEALDLDASPVENGRARPDQDPSHVDDSRRPPGLTDEQWHDIAWLADAQETIKRNAE